MAWLTSLAVGSHRLTANYSGDSNNASSASTAVTETVNPMAKSEGATSGGGSFKLIDLCALVLLALWRVIAGIPTRAECPEILPRSFQPSKNPNAP